MDKHQRKYLARWETNKARRQAKFEEKMRNREFDATVDSLEAYSASYEPDMTEFLKTALPILDIPRAASMFRYITLQSYGYPQWLFRPGATLRERYTDIMWWRNIKFDERKLERVIDVEASKAAIRRAKTDAVFIHEIERLQRQVERTEIIKEELLDVAHKFRTIATCKHIKEELMMAAWHPRRVERILDLYGWEAYENLLGVE